MNTSDPEKPAKNLVKITRQGAARGQLEGAILLWFLEANVAAVHTLAVAAQTILHNVGTKKNKPSALVTWLRTQPPWFQKRAVQAQNFLKHANKDPERVLIYAPLIGDIYIMDAMFLFEELYHFLTPLMRTFALRFSLDHPDILELDGLPIKFPQGFKIERLKELNRTEFLDAILPSMRDK
jgi:hypothetical protein